MQYKFLREYLAKGYFEEPLYDDNPTIASHTKEIFIKYDIGDYFDQYKEVREGVIELLDSSYGVSLHGSRAFLYLSLQELVEKGILEEVTEREYGAYIERMDCWEKYRIARLQLAEVETYIENYGPDTDIIENYIAKIMEVIHAKADYVIASL